MLLKTFFVTVCLLKLTQALDPCDSFNINDTTEPMTSMARSSTINGKKFVLVTIEKVNWFRADNICRYNGKQLAIINSSAEQEAVTKLIDESAAPDNGFWISGNDLACRRNWYWSSNGNPIDYFNWAVGEPNNSQNKDERCINIAPKIFNYMWNDAPCDYAFYFICEEDCGCKKT